eukprot:2122575-Alexandrium_andersonii.AAC.1
MLQSSTLAAKVGDGARGHSKLIDSSLPHSKLIDSSLPRIQRALTDATAQQHSNAQLRVNAGVHGDVCKAPYQRSMLDARAIPALRKGVLVSRCAWGRAKLVLLCLLYTSPSPRD